MRTCIGIMVCLVVVASSTTAQFKSQRETEQQVSDGVNPVGSPSLLFGFFDPDKFQMHHSFSLSYITMGGQGMSLSSYTNSMMYSFSDQLNARADVSFLYSPYSSIGNATGNGKNQFSSLFLSRAELNYRPWNNVLFKVQYRQLPYTSMYSPFYGPFSGEGGY